MALVVLIDPRGWQGAVNGCQPSPNIGIAYLVPVLRRHGHEVVVIDLNNEAIDDDSILNLIEKLDADIVGISAKTATMKDSRNLAQKVKAHLPLATVVLGGPHTKFAYEQLVAEPWFDIVFVGEAEKSLPLLCDRLAKNESVDELPGVITRASLQRRANIDRALINGNELDYLPFPEFDLFPQNVRVHLRKGYQLVTSRGCVYNCTYCSVPEISGKTFRKRSIVNLIEELRWAQKKYDVSHFEIIDDVFNLDIERSKQMCRALIEADSGLTWSCPNGLRADRVDAELADLMAESGCLSVMVGVESADPMVLSAVKKGETIEDIEKGIKIFKEAGIHVGGYFIIGLPGDSFESQRRSVDFAKSLDIEAHFNMLTPYPGTEIWEWAKLNARFLRDIEEGLHFADDPKKLNIVIETDDFSSVDRQRAYELVHTLLGRFDLLIPPNLNKLKYIGRKVFLLWKYDRRKFPSYILHVISEKMRGFIGKILWTL